MQLICGFVFTYEKSELMYVTGIDCPRGSRPGPAGTTIPSDPYGEEATVFTKELCLQREVVGYS